MQDQTHAEHRNKVFLFTFTENLYRELFGKSDYSMSQIESLVHKCAGDVFEINKFFDAFTIEFAEWCVNQHWEKASASLGVDEDGNNVAKSTAELLDLFKQQKGIY